MSPTSPVASRPPREAGWQGAQFPAFPECRIIALPAHKQRHGRRKESLRLHAQAALTCSAQGLVRGDHATSRWGWAKRTKKAVHGKYKGLFASVRVLTRSWAKV